MEKLFFSLNKVVLVEGGYLARWMKIFVNWNENILWLNFIIGISCCITFNELCRAIEGEIFGKQTAFIE